MDSYAPTADLYDHVTIYRDRPDLPFFVEAARESGGPVLEIGCGTGRVLIPTARAGVAIVGLDASPAMLAICRRDLAELLLARAGFVVQQVYGGDDKAPFGSVYPGELILVAGVA